MSKTITLKTLLSESKVPSITNSNIQSVCAGEFLKIKKKTEFCKLLNFKLTKEGRYNWAFNAHCRDNSIPTQFRFDVDIKVHGNDPRTLYTEQQVKSTVLICFDEIRKKITNISEEHLICAVLVKEPYIDKKQTKDSEGDIRETHYIKNGFHLEFPYLYMPNLEISSICKCINSRLVTIFKEGFKPDYGFCSNAWLLYGASKKGSDLYYRVDYFLDSKLDKIQPPVCENKYINLFWLYPGEEDTIYNINYYEQSSPRWPAKAGCGADNEELELVEGGDSGEEPTEEDDDTFNSEKDRIEYMLSTLAQNRVEESHSWYSIVCGCKNYGEENKLDLRPILREWSKTTYIGNFSDEGFNRAWEKDTKFTIQSLEKFWHKDNKNFRNILRGTDDALARLIKDEFKGKMFLVGDDSKVAFIYDEKNGLWPESDKSDTYTKALPFLKDQVRKTWGFLKKKEKWLPTGKSESDKEKRKAHKALISQLNKTSLKIENTIGKRSIVSFLVTHIKNRDFEEKLNQHLTLFPIQGNLVVNLETGESFPRQQYHYFTWEAPVTITTNQKALNWAENWFFEIANKRPELSTFLKTIFLYFLSGLTFDRCFYQFIGEGLNGKSLYLNILQKLLGPVSMTGAKKIIIATKYKNDSGAEPEICRMRGKRLVAFTETKPGDLLNNETLKSLSGGDSQSARMLFSNDIKEFVMTGKILIATNNQLECFENDPATNVRNIVVPFDATFEKNEDFKNAILENRDERLSAIFTVALKEGAIHMKNKKIPRPQEVEIKTKEVSDDMDTVLNFIHNECDTECKESAIHTTKLFSAFLSYCIRNRYPTPSDKFFSKEMMKKGYEKKKGTTRSDRTMKYIGITLLKDDISTPFGSAEPDQLPNPMLRS
jgi:P4 family phage/plasmid primase-like protien